MSKIDKLRDAGHRIMASGWYFQWEMLLPLMTAMLVLTYNYVVQLALVILSIFVVAVIAPPIAIIMAIIAHIDVLFYGGEGH